MLSGHSAQNMTDVPAVPAYAKVSLAQVLLRPSCWRHQPTWKARLPLADTELRLRNYLTAALSDPEQDKLVDLKLKSSMLHVEVLHALQFLTGITSGPIVECGAYIGGATVAIAASLYPGRTLITIEAGGAHDHDMLPSRDILRDLRATLKRHGVADRVAVLAGDCHAYSSIAALRQMLGWRRIGMLVLDADGDIDRHMECFGHLLKKDAILVIDDYRSMDDEVHATEGEPPAERYRGYRPRKDHLVRSSVDRLEREGIVESIGVYGWGTWIGRMKRRLPVPQTTHGYRDP